jgi:hypothetical protein
LVDIATANKTKVPFERALGHFENSLLAAHGILSFKKPLLNVF